MGDYMFMLESHLSAEQFRVVGQMRQLAGDAGINLFLTGGAMRDMLGGFPVRDLDFTIEGNAIKLAKVAEKKFGATIVQSHVTKVDLSTSPFTVGSGQDNWMSERFMARPIRSTGC